MGELILGVLLKLGKKYLAPPESNLRQMTFVQRK
jgi:hypothetical protein